MSAPAEAGTGLIRIALLSLYVWAMTTYRPSMTAAKVLIFDPKPSVAVSGITGVFPNPFNPKTGVSSSLAEEAAVRLAVYDLKDCLVRTLVGGIL